MADIKIYGRVAKLVDALDLGSSAFGMGVRVSSRPPYKRTLRKVLFLFAFETPSQLVFLNSTQNA